MIKLNDETLVEKSRQGDENALDILLQRYKPLVKSKVKTYYQAGGDPEDLIQEGMIGLYKAVLGYDSTKRVTFAAFAALCILRQVQTAIKTASRLKHIPLNTSLSLDNETGEQLPAHRDNDPEALFLGREALKHIDDYIKTNLSELEYSVFVLHMDGKSHMEIADALGKSAKSVDNTLQRIRRKIEKIKNR